MITQRLAILAYMIVLSSCANQNPTSRIVAQVGIRPLFLQEHMSEDLLKTQLG